MTTPGKCAAPTTPAWDGAELANPHAHAEKPSKVRRMFAAIAPSYDLNNRLHSLGIDRYWRRVAVRRAGVRAGEHVLDVACGTGDLTQGFAASPAARVVGLDFTREMLDIAERKRARLPAGSAAKVTYIEGDATALPFDTGSFDVVSIAFGIRNVSDVPKALGEFHRVLRPGGRLIVLEFDTPRNRIVRWLNTLYCARIMPRTATWISGDRSGAYAYLPASVNTFMSREALKDFMHDAGFARMDDESLTLGLCACYRAWKG
ncbi:MAG: demethylmenaquinone methyltransferase [Phycisphaerae bacterium]|nr:MAG: demethylmenaquinone methyltransferase [Phycisphaerae bacterium]